MNKIAVYTCYKNKNSKVIENNLSTIMNKCLMKNYTYDLYVDKVKHKTNYSERVKLKQLKKEIENCKYSKIVVPDMTHLLRDRVQLIQFLDFMDEHNCIIECLDGTDITLYKQLAVACNKIAKEERER